MEHSEQMNSKPTACAAGFSMPIIGQPASHLRVTLLMCGSSITHLLHSIHFIAVPGVWHYHQHTRMHHHCTTSCTSYQQLCYHTSNMRILLQADPILHRQGEHARQTVMRRAQS